MAYDFTDWDLSSDEYRAELLRIGEEDRKDTLRHILVDLVTLAKTLGQSPEQARSKVQGFYQTFSAELFTYIYVDGSFLSDAIAANATLAWLDILVGGVSIRQRLINRLA